MDAARHDELPIGMVAIDDGPPVGTVVLRRTPVVGHGQLGPWVTTLWVKPESRNRGFGSALVEAVESEARRLGFAELFCAADPPALLLARRGWRETEGDVATLRDPVSIYRLGLGVDT